jgi:hypothetical protein
VVPHRIATALFVWVHHVKRHLRTSSAMIDTTSSSCIISGALLLPVAGRCANEWQALSFYLAASVGFATWKRYVSAICQCRTKNVSHGHAA